MGAIKLKYYERWGALEASPLFVVSALERKLTRKKADVKTYPYGFNGMERDDEVKGSGNSYDFGSRMHDPRLGRLKSVDPLFKDYPSQSPYLYAGNNPIYFIDEEGEKKTTYLTVIDQNGKSQTFEIVDDDKVMTEIVGYTYIGTFNGAKRPITQDYDINEYITIDLSQGDPIIKTSGELKGKERNWYTSLDEGLGGIVMSSSSGEGGAVEGAGDGRIMNIDELVAALGGFKSASDMKSPLSGKAKTKLDKTKEIFTAIKEVASANGYGDALGKAFGVQDETSTYCRSCRNNYLDKNGILSREVTDAVATDTVNSHGENSKAN